MSSVLYFLLCLMLSVFAIKAMTNLKLIWVGPQRQQRYPNNYLMLVRSLELEFEIVI